MRKRGQSSHINYWHHNPCSICRNGDCLSAQFLWSLWFHSIFYAKIICLWLNIWTILLEKTKENSLGILPLPFANCLARTSNNCCKRVYYWAFFKLNWDIRGPIPSSFIIRFFFFFPFSFLIVLQQWSIILSALQAYVIQWLTPLSKWSNSASWHLEVVLPLAPDCSRRNLLASAQNHCSA